MNGYDAGASTVKVYLPGEFAAEAVLVWDDGHSMNQAQLHELWWAVSYTHLRAHETVLDLVCRLLLEKKKRKTTKKKTKNQKNNKKKIRINSRKRYEHK